VTREYLGISSVALLWCVIVGLGLLAGCSGLKVEGGCTYQRTVTTSYVCPVDGHLQHFRLAPGSPEP
jgi:hypothetical protein